MRLFFTSKILLLTTCLQAIGIFIFLKGFLLTRQTFDLKGHSYDSWDRFPLSSPVDTKNLPTTIQKSPFKRTIVMVVDALRFDFVVPNKTSNSYYLNKLPILNQLVLQQPESSLLFQFRADPPTTTMQRVKGLMTGSLPTFIDAGANFASSAVGEDHLLRQIQSQYDSIYFFGDDTWVNLFPDSFQSNRTYASDSFKMLDLDSVDDDIESHLWPLLEEEKSSDWQLVLAHFLGVDHCGHTYGPSDPNMQRKLEQMNAIITKLLAHVDDETLFIVMGDHGMSVDGDHGGESIEELTSTLFMHSKRPLKKMGMDPFYQQIHQQRYELLGYDFDQISNRLSYRARGYPMVAQIHLVPTLSYLLNVPIPFGNLGAIIPDLILADMPDSLSQYIHMVEQFRKNALQVYDYLDQYEKQTHQLDFSRGKLDPIFQHLLTAEETLLTLFEKTKFLKEPTEDTEAMLKEVILLYDAYLIHTMKYCAAIWAQFDSGCMWIGILILGATTCLSVWYMMNNSTLNITASSVVTTTACGLLGLLCAYLRYTTFADYVLRQGWFEKMTVVDWISAIIVLSLCCGAIIGIPLNFQAYSTDFYISLVSIILQSLTLGSNSFVVWEDRGSRFFLITLSLFWLWYQIRSVNQYNVNNIISAVTSPIVFMALVRILGLTGQCREEQFPYCDYFHSGTLEFGIDSNLGYFSIGVVIFTFTCVIYCSSTLTENSTIVAALYQCSGMFVIFRMIFEIAQRSVGNVEKTEMVLKIQKYVDVYLPRVIYAMCGLGIILVTTTNILHTRFKRYNKRTLKIWTLMLFFSQILALLQRPLGTAIMVFTPLLIELLSYGDSTSQWIRLSLVYFLGHYLFFVTGHQATFTSLPWKAAFIGFEDMNYYGGIVLVTLSTLAGYIMSWIGWVYLVPTTESTVFLLVLFQTVPTFLSAIFIFVLKRHLMTWKIFAPRFLLQVLLEIGVHVIISVFY